MNDEPRNESVKSLDSRFSSPQLRNYSWHQSVSDRVLFYQLEQNGWPKIGTKLARDDSELLVITVIKVHSVADFSTYLSPIDETYAAASLTRKKTPENLESWETEGKKRLQPAAMTNKFELLKKAIAYAKNTLRPRKRRFLSFPWREKPDFFPSA